MQSMITASSSFMILFCNRLNSKIFDRGAISGFEEALYKHISSLLHLQLKSHVYQQCIRLCSAYKIFAIPPWAPKVAVPSAQWKGEFSLPTLPVLLQDRPVHSRWLDLPCGMDFCWNSDCSPGFTLTHSALTSKLYSLAMLG